MRIFLHAALAVCVAVPVLAGPPDAQRYREEFARHAALLNADQAMLHRYAGSHKTFLLKKAGSADPAERSAALRLLGQWDMVPDASIDDPEVGRAVRAAAWAEVPSVRHLALYYLSYTPLEADDTDLVVRLLELARRGEAEAVRALGAFEDASLIGPVRRLVEEQREDPQIRRAASHALARLGDEGYRLFWLGELESGREIDRRAGLKAAAYIRDPRAMPLLLEMLDEERDQEDLIRASLALLAHRALRNTVAELGKEPPALPDDGWKPKYRKHWERWWRQHRSEIQELIETR